MNNALEQMTELTDEIELKLDEADRFAEESGVRYSHDEVFGGIRAALHGSKAI